MTASDMTDVSAYGADAPVRRQLQWLVLFLVAELGVLVLIVVQALPSLLPGALATQVGHNSEAFLLAILVSLTIAWVRSRDHSWGADATVVVVIGVVVLLAAGLFLLTVDNPRLKTLNEPVIAAALLLGYCSWRRRTKFLALLSPAALTLTAVFFRTDVVQLQAESIVALILAPISLDLAARWMLRPGVSASVAPSVAWTGFLLLAPFVLMALRQLELGSALDATVLYAAHSNEAFWGWFLVHALGLLAWSPTRRAPGIRSA